MNMVDIVVFGAKGDGISDNTAAFEKAFSCENAHICVPEGLWLTGPVTLKSHSSLHLAKGAVLKFIDNQSLYRPVYSRWEGIRCWCMHPCIYSENSVDVSVSGEGTIDGNGKSWWLSVEDKKKRGAGPETEVELLLAKLNPSHGQQPGGGGGRGTQFLRPPLVQFNGCRDVKISEVTLRDSPFWTIHPVFCDGVTLSDVKIVNPPVSPNTDAVDVDSCSNVRIHGCDISVGDDGITLKSGNGQDGIAAGKPTEDVLVEDCVVRRAHGGVVIGSETAAGIGNVVFRNCRFTGTDRGIRVKTRRGRGGKIHDIVFSDINIDGCLCPVTMNMYYRCGTTEMWPFTMEKLPVNDETPEISNVIIRNVKATGCRSSAGFFVGLPESEIANVEIRDCEFSMGEDLVSTDDSEMYIGPDHTDDRGMRIINADVKTVNVRISGVEND